MKRMAVSGFRAADEADAVSEFRPRMERMVSADFGRGWSGCGQRQFLEVIMCLGIPGQVKDIYETAGIRMGKVDFAGITKEICLAYVPEIQVGDYTIVHVGFAITQLDEAAAQESLRLFTEMGRLEEELNPDLHPDAGAGLEQPLDLAPGGPA
jgi:hydrogenase expression/formation protein HypC